MNRILLLAMLLGSLSSPRAVSAAPEQCSFPTGELLQLSPGQVLVDGISLARSPTGRFATDAGLEFDMERATVQAELTGSMPGCEQPSGLVRLDVIDPFTNQVRFVALELQP